MDDRQRNARGSMPGAQAACAVAGGLLLVWLLASAFAAGEWNFAGQMPPEGEFATTWHKLNVPQDRSTGETDLARRR
jgi:hypothetical protein